MHILLADDNNDTRHLFAMSFILAGHRVETAPNGIEALALLKQQRFDAVVLDVEMPHMSGWKVLEAMRQLPFGRQVPVILFTASHSASLEVQAKSAGAHALLRKPVFPASLLEVMEKAVKERGSAPSAPSSATPPENVSP